ncbi:MAG: hypothetical protein ACOYMA_21020 [Bacteroidia bacterium]
MNEYREKIVTEVERLSQVTGINNLLDMGLTSIKELQKWLVKELYYEEKRKGGKTCIDIKYDLSDEYNVSVSQIEKLIYR